MFKQGKTKKRGVMTKQELEGILFFDGIKKGDLVRISWDNSVDKTWPAQVRVFRFGQIVHSQLLVYDKDDQWLHNSWRHIPISKIQNIELC